MPMAQKTPGYGKSSMNNNVFLKRVSPNQPKLIGRFFLRGGQKTATFRVIE